MGVTVKDILGLLVHQGNLALQGPQANVGPLDPWGFVICPLVIKPMAFGTIPSGKDLTFSIGTVGLY